MTLSSRAQRVAATARPHVAVDRRALAAFRIALGAVLLVDLATRAPDLVAFYTDAGVLPREVLAALYPRWHHLSLHALSGAAWVQAALFVLAGVAAVALLVGYRTRLAAAASLVLLVSLHVRNPVVLNAGDALLRRLVFWGLFLPLGSRWAVDGGGVDDQSVAGPATVGLLGQVVVVYVANAVVKFRGSVWPGGDAVRYAFQVDHFTVLLGDVVAGWATLLTLVDWAWLVMLVCSPLLVVLTGRWRGRLAGAFVAAHVGMALTLDIVVFPLVSVAALLPFLPAGVWDRLEARVPEEVPAVGEPREPLARRVPALSGLARAVAATAIAVLVVVNAVALGVVAAPPGTPDRVESRTWDMFAPSPPRGTWWYAAPGTLESGARVDLLARDRVDLSRPDDVASRYPNGRWRKFLATADDEPRLRRSLAAHLCRRWNRAHEDEVVRLRLVHLSEATDLDGPEHVERRTLGTYRCEAGRAPATTARPKHRPAPLRVWRGGTTAACVGTSASCWPNRPTGSSSSRSPWRSTTTTGSTPRGSVAHSTGWSRTASSPARSTASTTSTR